MYSEKKNESKNVNDPVKKTFNFVKLYNNVWSLDYLLQIKKVKWS